MLTPMNLNERSADDPGSENVVSSSTAEENVGEEISDNGKMLTRDNKDTRAENQPNLSFLPPGTMGLLSSSNGQATLYLGTFQVIAIPISKDNIGPKPSVPGVATPGS